MTVLFLLLAALLNPALTLPKQRERDLYLAAAIVSRPKVSNAIFEFMWQKMIRNAICQWLMFIKGIVIFGTVGLVTYEELFPLQEEERCMNG